MARLPARRGAGFIRAESGRLRVIVELGVSPPAVLLGKSLAVLLHEEKVCQSVRHVHDKRRFRTLLGLPLDLRDLGALRKRLAVTRNTGLESRDYGGIAQDHLHPVIRLRAGDKLPV